MLFPKSFVFYSPDDSGGGATDDVAPDGGTPQDQNQDVSNTPTGGSPGTWDEYLKTLQPEAKTLYEGHIAGLRNTVTATREERDEFKNQLSDVIQALDGKKPGQVKDELVRLESNLTELTRRSQFFEEAALLSGPDSCTNVRLAWMTANAENLFQRDGSPDWGAIKEIAPEIFGAKVPAAHGGSGTQNPPEEDKTDPNTVLRRMAGFS